ncbi:monosaccharide ABC transporter membrane protein, CUT2 family [Arboricoccus pini]|uniref:Monosaccharide ABC transporter membrane protein, CUT2 family n=1 Tax=Arboricoccus pini TaxID=1963835 RepID=A0A212S1I8_9PROT|nr:ABC transporter permease [Arboricoccus pini]SNB78854.1 monosaccharide ABC transporter membrane protein, CUT2 family [Arboricoccus pini]
MHEQSTFLSRLQRRPEAWLLAVILLAGLALSLASPTFLTLPNIVDLLESYAVQAIMALGLFVVLVSGGIDISFAATASVAQYVAAAMAAYAGLPPLVCIGAGLLIGVALGLLNAALIHYVRITSIIATIATMSVYFSFLMYVTGGRSIYNLPDWWTDRITFYETETTSGDLVRITLPIVALLVAALLTWLLMTRSKVGRQLYAMGGNPEAARRIGINIAGMQFFAYGFLGFMSAAAGLLQAHRVGESVPNALYGNELAVLSAAVLGGASLTGGIGTVPGVLLGIVLLAMLQNGLNLLGVSSYFFQIVIGLVILISTSITVLSARQRRRRRPIGEALNV